MKSLRILLIGFVFALLPRVVFADPVAVIHEVVAVATTSTAVVTAASSGRKLLVVVNDSDATVYCKFDGAAAVLNEGIRLNANGGTVFFDVSVPTAGVNCIHGGVGTKNVTVSRG